MNGQLKKGDPIAEAVEVSGMFFQIKTDCVFKIHYIFGDVVSDQQTEESGQAGVRRAADV